MEEKVSDAIVERSKKLAMSNKLVREDKKIMMVALYMMFYNNRKRIFCRDMGIGVVIFESWLTVYKIKADELIQNFKDNVRKSFLEEYGIEQNEAPVPTVDSIKANILTKLYDAVKVETDPAKLASALKVIDKYQDDEAEKKKKKTKDSNIYDSIKNNA